MRHALRGLPGHLAFLLATSAATLFCVVQLNSFFYEAWGQPLFIAARGFLLPALLVVVVLVAVRRPRAGGVLLLALGLAGGSWWLWRQSTYDGLSSIVLFTAVVFFSPALVIGVLFLFEARHRRLLAGEEAQPHPRWWARNYRSLLAVGVPVLALVVVSVQKVPEMLQRHDDGFRGARRLEANGVALVWAPAGPGWNWRLPDGGHPSWIVIATFGAAPAGLKASDAPTQVAASADDMVRTGVCGFLSEDGTSIMPAPAHIWRLPTADEGLRSLTRGGENAGCVWDGRSPHAACRCPPDKETPLWAPDQAPIYYWTSDTPDPTHAVGVNYTGGLTLHPKSAGGVGFRCVKPAR